MILTGDSLGKRQEDLNTKVNEAAAKNIPFEEIDKEDDTSDVYKIFKIDLASKYKKIDYIIEVLKSGDALIISRALKCIWIYDDEHSKLINPNYLEKEIFPFMSTKMKNKFLKNISTYVRNETRAQDFFQYCMKENLGNIAFKFLIFTSLEFKTNFIEKNGEILESIISDENNIVFLLDKNFDLAELFLSVTSESQRVYYLFILRHLYFIDAERYLKTWEKYFYGDNGALKQSMRGRLENGRSLGLRISKDIMLKHKQRTLKYIKLYTKLVNRSMLRKYITMEEAKLYLVGLLPEDPKEFWKIRFQEKYDFLLNFIPDDDKYSFIRNIFRAKYPNSEFEMSKEFYNQEYYKFMSSEEQESWALRHLDNPNKTFLSNRSEDKDYLWYKFVRFDKAFAGIKKYILNTTSAYTRNEIIKVLIKSVTNEVQLQKLLEYYYERHVNETEYFKTSFLSEIISCYNLWEVSEHCWTAFNKLLYSIELYNPAVYNTKEFPSVYGSQNDYLAVAVYYHILHGKELPETLKMFVESDSDYYLHLNLSKMKNNEQKEIMYQYLIKLLIGRVKNCLQSPEKDTDRLAAYIRHIKSIQEECKKNNDDLPEIVLQYMAPPPPKLNVVKKPSRALTQPMMLRYLKQDSQSVLSQIPLLKENFSKTDFDFVLERLPQEVFRLNIFLRKLRIYFTEDMAQTFLKYFIASLSEDCDSRNVFAAVYGILLLADESFASEFMMKYAPTDSKIDHSTINRKDLYIQEAICRFAGYSRPQVPLDILSMYMKGDYVKYCLPLFYMYGANLTPQHREQFIDTLINAPVSVQMHGLRLAFKCLDIENLKAIIQKIWKRSKNISLRRIIYTYLYNEIMKKKVEHQFDLFKLLITLTSQLKHEDHEDVINLMTGCRIQNELAGEYFEKAWTTLNKFPEDDKNLNRRVRFINTITSRVNDVDARVIRNIIDDYLNDMFMNKFILPNHERTKFNQLYRAKFTLTTSFIAQYDDEENIKSVLPLVQYILNKCFETWDLSCGHKEETKYVSRMFCYKFITRLEWKHFELEKNNNVTFNVILENIAKQLLEFLPFHEVYLLIWRLRLAIAANKILDSKVKIKGSQEKESVKNISKIYAAEIDKIMKGLVDQGKFSVSHTAPLSKISVLFLDILTKPAKSVNIQDAATFLAEDLVNLKSTECMLLAVNVLPKQPSNNSIEERERVIKTIKNSESFEVQASYFQNMVITWSTYIPFDLHLLQSDCSDSE